MLLNESNYPVQAANAAWALTFRKNNELIINCWQRLEWQSTDAHRELCQLKGKSTDECQNYPRVAARAHGRLLVCGTNAFKPLCRRYARHPANHHLEEFDGSGRCPYDPQHNSTAIFVGKIPISVLFHYLHMPGLNILLLNVLIWQYLIEHSLNYKIQWIKFNCGKIFNVATRWAYNCYC